MVEIQNLTKNFGQTLAVDKVSFEVKKGENLIMLGTSGCGKTTTLKMINRLIEPNQGEIFINGKNINAQKPELLRRKIGYVMQNTGLFPHYTVEQNIGVLPQLLKWDKKITRQKTEELLNKLHLPEASLTMYPNQLSGGQQQRVGLARALIADTELLLMDEPFGALDNVTRNQIQKEFKALPEFQNKTIIMVTHDVQEAFELADRIVLMDKGKVVQIGTPKDLLYRPINEFAEQFLDAQRLALELKIVSLNDLWPYLSLNNLACTTSISSSINVWDSMEMIRKSDHSCFQVSNTKGEKRDIDFQVLTQAFNHFQIAQANERT
ncbi:ATP-binding cassette domain-containing protein [Pedobacter changchengzhani]|uniref:ATP-binding cassette domain-containing protein n=1 Tax=Pedobacter changchengzhani TaxID=2529274 RepID=A0A4R5MK49_9SPHI|nr:ATP-binding cassette domain-containing protein [Pedobacter changchengzhani]TDG36001.1 ATP-binding cassette domain-containing protein [Pedobacter changchengzhani]